MGKQVFPTESKMSRLFRKSWCFFLCYVMICLPIGCETAIDALVAIPIRGGTIQANRYR
jgi:hypothetical protein